MSAFKNFLLGYQKKYRMWVEGATEEETSQPESGGNEKEYLQMLHTMRQLGIEAMPLDLQNLKAYPTTVKLYHQLLAYPHEIIPLMDQAIKDVMVDQAEEEMNRLLTEQRQGRPLRAADSSFPAIPSSEANQQAAAIPDLVLDVETKIFRVKPFGLEKSHNMRELNPNGAYFKELTLGIY